MVLAEIGTAGVISAYFFRHMTSGYSLNVSDPIKGQPVQLSDYLFVSGCGLVFWLLVMLRAKLHDSGGRQSDIRKVAKLAKLIAPITTLNLCGCLLAPFMKLPLLVRFLVLFQVSSNLALLLIWAFLSLKECMILPDTHTPQKSSPEVRVELSIPSNPIPHGRSSLPISKLRGHRNRRIFKEFFEFSNLQSSFSEGAEEGRGVTNAYVPKIISGSNVQVNVIQASSAYGFSRTKSSGTNSKVNAICGKVDEAGGSGSGHCSGASGKEENRGRYGGNDGGGGAGGGGGGDRGESGGGHGSRASGSGENSGGYGGHGRDEWGTGSGHGSGAGGSGENRGGDEGHGQDEGGTGSGHGSGAGGSGENRGGDEGHGQDETGTGGGHGSGAGGSGGNRGGSEGGDRPWEGGEGDPECGVSGTNTEQAFKSSSYSITEMSLMLTAQTTSTLIGFHVIPTPSSSSKSFLVVALMDQLVAYLCGLTSIMLKSSNKPEAAEIFEKIGFVCTALGFILMVAMFVQWEFVLIALLLFGVVWFYFFGNDLKTNLRKCIANLKKFIGMPSESGS